MIFSIFLGKLVSFLLSLTFTGLDKLAYSGIHTLQIHNIFTVQTPEAVFLVMCNPSMNELWAT
jgi:hypothetical protein